MAFMLDNAIRRFFQNPVRLLGGYIAAGQTVVDVGCGPGFFTIEMARMVGPEGQVFAVDLQPAMLQRVRRKALRHGVAERMRYHQCRADRIDLSCAADFMLAYYMVHETPDPGLFFGEAITLLRAGGRLLVVEPRMHVGRAVFAAMLHEAESVGFTIEGHPKGQGGRAALLARPSTL
jgi:ubiquinone/menaquinone biosynthesis C-methylase UbiE